MIKLFSVPIVNSPLPAHLPPPFVLNQENQFWSNVHQTNYNWPTCRLWLLFDSSPLTSPHLSSSRPLWASDPRSSGAPVCSHGNPFLSRPQTADGGSTGPKLSKPFPTCQLKSEACVLRGQSSLWMQQTCASPSVHTDCGNVNLLITCSEEENICVLFVQHKPGRWCCCKTAILMHTDLKMRLSGGAASFSQPYIPTP